MERWVKNNIIYNGKILSLLTGQASIDDGSLVKREVVLHAAGVGVVPVIGDSIVFVEQYRIAVERNVLEIPAGIVDEGEAPEAAAARELREETGFIADKLQLTNTYYSSVGFTNEKIYVYVADQLVKSTASPDSEENLIQKIIPINEVQAMLLNNKFEDAKTIIGLQSLFANMDRK